ncbi:hypothetical protein MMC30_002517 [Trapelia coarctata]|nr:hypothetical protein [Trapelia coarctata]
MPYSSETAQPAGMSAFDYWRTTAFSSPLARALASQLNLDLFDPSTTRYSIYGLDGPCFKGGLMYPVRRLVVTGQDTPENMVILFGPKWEADVKQIWKHCRMEVFSPPPVGLKEHQRARELDQGAPGWMPRLPSAEEEAELKKLADMTRLAELIQLNDELGSD